jgi:hypothetical protein
VSRQTWAKHNIIVNFIKSVAADLTGGDVSRACNHISSDHRVADRRPGEAVKLAWDKLQRWLAKPGRSKAYIEEVR